MKYQGYSLIKYCSTNLFPVYLREKISLKKYIRNNLSQTFIRCTFWYLKSWRNTKRKFLLQNGMSMAITVLILCVPWYQVNKNSQTNTNCMYIRSYEDLIIWYNDKTFFCWLLLESYLVVSHATTLQIPASRHVYIMVFGHRSNSHGPTDQNWHNTQTLSTKFVVC